MRSRVLSTSLVVTRVLLPIGWLMPPLSNGDRMRSIRLRHQPVIRTVSACHTSGLVYGAQNRAHDDGTLAQPLVSGRNVGLVGAGGRASSSSTLPWGPCIPTA